MQTERKQKQAVMRILLLKSNLGERTVSFAEMDRAVSAENKKSDGIDVETEDLVAELEAQGVLIRIGEGVFAIGGDTAALRTFVLTPEEEVSKETGIEIDLAELMTSVWSPEETPAPAEDLEKLFESLKRHRRRLERRYVFENGIYGEALFPRSDAEEDEPSPDPFPKSLDRLKRSAEAADVRQDASVLRSAREEREIAAGIELSRSGQETRLRVAGLREQTAFRIVCEDGEKYLGDCGDTLSALHAKAGSGGSMAEEARRILERYGVCVHGEELRVRFGAYCEVPAKLMELFSAMNRLGEIGEGSA